MGNSIGLIFCHSFSSKNINKEALLLRTCSAEKTYFGEKIISRNVFWTNERKEGQEEGRKKEGGK